jgi:phosphatidylglycerol---prolipoprotein diacylglyceryl transferase
LVVVAAHLALLLAFLPSPPSPVAFEVGSFALSYYGLLIALGIAVGAWLTGRELTRRGYDGALALEALLFVVPLGVLGARLDYVATEYESQFAAHHTSIVQIWNGGLGIYGAVAGGFLGALLFAWVRGLNVLAFADAAAPGVVLGQAIGRWGDYFNQELFGRPSDLPWAIGIAPENRPPEFADAQTFHPAFLYESIWDVLVCLLLLLIARRFAERLRVGDVFLLYLILYSVGYLGVGTLRVDPTSFVIWGSVSGDLFVAGVVAFGSALLLLLRYLLSPRDRSNKDGRMAS